MFIKPCSTLALAVLMFTDSVLLETLALDDFCQCDGSFRVHKCGSSLKMCLENVKFANPEFINSLKGHKLYTVVRLILC